MRTGKVIGVLTSLSAAILLVLQPASVFASNAKAAAKSNQALPPAIAMLKNLKKQSAKHPVISLHKPTKKKVVVKKKIKKPIKHKQLVQKIITTEKKRIAKKRIVKKPVTTKLSATAIMKKAKVKRVAVKQPAPKKAFVPETKSYAKILTEQGEQDDRPEIKPENVVVNQTDLEERRKEIEGEIALLKAKEEAEAAAAAAYYAEHRHEMKKQEIAEGLAKRNHNLAKINAEPIRQVYSQNGNKNIAAHVADKPNVLPIQGPNIKLRHSRLAQRHRDRALDIVDHKKNRPTRASADGPAPAITDNIDYSPIPEGARLVAGNPYEDEFFIVGEESSKEVKQLASEAGTKDYVPAVVMAAQHKRANNNAVKSLINTVTNRIAHTAKYISDPIVHYMASRKLASAKPKLKPKPVQVNPLQAPRYAAEKIATRMFANKSVQQVKPKHSNAIDVRESISRQIKEKNLTPRKVATVKPKKQVKPKKLAIKQQQKKKLAVKQVQPKSIKAKPTGGFKPIIKHYADMVASPKAVKPASQVKQNSIAQRKTQKVQKKVVAKTVVKSVNKPVHKPESVTLAKKMVEQPKKPAKLSKQVTSAKKIVKSPQKVKLAKKVIEQPKKVVKPSKKVASAKKIVKSPKKVKLAKKVIEQPKKTMKLPKKVELAKEVLKQPKKAKLAKDVEHQPKKVKQLQEANQSKAKILAHRKEKKGVVRSPVKLRGEEFNAPYHFKRHAARKNVAKTFADSRPKIKPALKQDATKMHATSKFKPKKVAPEDEDVMNDAF